MGGAILVLNSQLTHMLLYRCPIHWHLMLCVLTRSRQISWNPYKWERHSFSTHNYSGWMATHTRNNNLVHFLWIYINLLNNHCSQEENQFLFVMGLHTYQRYNSTLGGEILMNSYETRIMRCKVEWMSYYIVLSCTNAVVMSWLSAPICGEFNSPYIAAYRQ